MMSEVETQVAVDQASSEVNILPAVEYLDFKHWILAA